MLRRIALTLVSCVAVYAVATTITAAPSAHAGSTVRRSTAPTTSAPRLAARSGYIVASS